MTNQTIDNSADGEFGKVILWQYDKAENLVAFVKSFLGVHNTLTRDLWDRLQKELNVDTASDFGLAILGRLIGVPRLKCDNGNLISTERYRQLIKAFATLSGTNHSYKDLDEFCATMGKNDFGVTVQIEDATTPRSPGLQPMATFDSITIVGKTYRVTEDNEQVYNLKMYVQRLGSDGEEQLIYECLAIINSDIVDGHPCAVRDIGSTDYPIFGFDGQQAKTDDDFSIGGFDDSTFIPEEYSYA